MPKNTRPRHGSLQFYPRKRAAKFLHRVNWDSLSNLKSEKESILGFIAYKVGMASAIVKDNTEHSLTKNKKIVVPVTILELPDMKVFAVRFYKDSKPIKDVIVSSDKELKKKLKLPKQAKQIEKEIPEKYDDIRLIVYSLPKQANLKKTPDIIEIAIHAKDKLAFASSLLNKEITIKEFSQFNLLDVKGLTKGKGLQGPVKRFGITLKAHKSEKGRRRPGSLAPWIPCYVTFRAPMAGQLGLFTRMHYNLRVIGFGSIKEKNINPKSGFSHYGNINTNYLILKGSVQGSQKRQVVLTPAQRPSKKQAKQNYQLLEVLHNGS